MNDRSNNKNIEIAQKIDCFKFTINIGAFASEFLDKCFLDTACLVIYSACSKFQPHNNSKLNALPEYKIAILNRQKNKVSFIFASASSTLSLPEYDTIW